jgi:hypothetical protein
VSQTYKRALWVGALIAIAMNLTYAASNAAAAEETHVFDAALSLTGACQAPSEEPNDPVPDPGCPGGTHPPGGRFISPAIAIDDFGDMYVASFDPPTSPVVGGRGANARVDVFSPAGVFITEIPVPRVSELAVDSKGNLYTYSEATSEANNTELKVWEPSAYDPVH